MFDNLASSIWKLAGCYLLAAWMVSGCQSPLPDEVAQAYQELPETVDFNFHIRPLLSDRCYACHGPDENTREAELRLDIEASAFASLAGSGGQAFVKGNLNKSKAWQRIISSDPEVQMPPPESHLSLSNGEKALIAKWIKQGAEWKEHWAFIPPSLPEIPAVHSDWARNPIDHFVARKWAAKELSPSPEADKTRLIRRLSFDLRGLPPSIAEIDAFLADETPDAYERLVDRFMTTDAYAERMALEWLDIARFGDTHGLHMDPERYNWPWRDWVIRAFQQNMPYDEFITWQMAGDLLPDATRDQKLATAFHRNHPSSSEGGIPDEEFRQKYVQDRTNTTATAFMGLTLECASCHDHKFDPISQKEYYQFSAFFNNLKEVGMVNEFRFANAREAVYASGPVMLMPEPDVEAELIDITKQIAIARKSLEQTRKEVAASRKFVEAVSVQSIKAPLPDAHFPFESLAPTTVERGVMHRSQKNRPIDQIVDNRSHSLACGDLEVVPGKIGNALRSTHEVDIVFIKEAGTFEVNEPFSASAWITTEKTGENQTIMGTSGEMGNAWRGWDFYLDSLNRPSITFISLRPQNYLHVTGQVSIPQSEWHRVSFTYAGTSKARDIRLYIDGQEIETHIRYDDLYRSLIRRWTPSKEWKTRPMMVFRSGRFHLGENGVFTGSIDELKTYRKCLSPLDVAAAYAAESKTEQEDLDYSDSDKLRHYLSTDQQYQSQLQQLQKLLAERLRIMELIPEIMVMEDMPTPRKTFVLNRGQYNAPTEEVRPGTPVSVLSFSEELPPNRLGLAQWLTDPENPLTARVAANRYWQMLFGRGLVATPHDFGTQGALPSHPELLDWLAITFVESGWDVRALLKLMVGSATYRQSSVATPDQLAADPENHFLSRAPSYRLQAEMIRDNALAASGLLHTKIGGPSVKPYQPDGVWDFGAGAGAYQADTGPNLYRRSLYTYIRRTAPHPAMVAFDAPNRLVCTAQRELTNTPQQALVLLNDPQFVEAARVLAIRMQTEGGKSLAERTQYAFRLLCGRTPTEREMELMRAQYEVARNKFVETPEAASELLSVGAYRSEQALDPIETAALTMVASTLMNFDEAYMRR